MVRGEFESYMSELQTEKIEQDRNQHPGMVLEKRVSELEAKFSILVESYGVHLNEGHPTTSTFQEIEDLKKANRVLLDRNIELSKHILELKIVRDELSKTCLSQTAKISEQGMRIINLNKNLSYADDERQEFWIALNRIAMMGSGAMAYTSDFTNKVMGIVRGALEGKKPAPRKDNIVLDGE